jgi:hypothetical protein
MWSIWGSSADNVYACGTSPVFPMGTLYRYDGKSWYPFTVPLGDHVYYELRGITGFAPNDIWVVGGRLYSGPQAVDSALILHFDGSKWTSVLPSHMGVAGLRRIYALSPRDIYCGSSRGQIMHFNGTTWTSTLLYPGLSINAIGGDRDRLFVSGNTWKGTRDDSVLTFAKSSESWLLVNVRDWSSIITAIHSVARGQYYATISNGLFRWDAGQWWCLMSEDSEVNAIVSSGPNDILIAGSGRSGPAAYHFDGISWAEIKLPAVPSRTFLSAVSAWSDGSQIFILCNDGEDSFVMHGK